MSSSDETLTLDDVDTIELAGPDRLAAASKHVAWSPESAVQLRMGNDWPENRPPVSLPTIVRR